MGHAVFAETDVLGHSIHPTLFAKSAKRMGSHVSIAL